MISFCIVISVVLLRTNGHDLFDLDEIILKFKTESIYHKKKFIMYHVLNLFM